MAKVIKAFFCVKTRKSYAIGDEYDGDRKDLSHVLEMEDKAIVPKRKTKRKSKK